MSSCPIEVRSEFKSHIAIASFFVSSGFSSTNSTFGASDFFDSPPNTERTRFIKLRNSNSRNISSTVSISIFSRNVFSGFCHLIGASRLIVARVLENNASSSPFFKSSIMRALIPAARNALSSFFNFLYKLSMVPKLEIKSLAVFSPIPTIPIILSD